MKHPTGFSPESDPSIAGYGLSSAFCLHTVKDDPVPRQGHCDMAAVKCLPISRSLRDVEFRSAQKVVRITGKFKASICLHIQREPLVKYGRNILWRALVDFSLEVKEGILKARRAEVYIACNAIEGPAAPERNGLQVEGIFQELQVCGDGIKRDVIDDPFRHHDHPADDRHVHSAGDFAVEGCGAVQRKARDLYITGDVRQLPGYAKTDMAPLPDLPGKDKALDFIFIIQPPPGL